MLQKKVYLDESTGLPNKNKCEEILGNPEPVSADQLTAVCVFDLNNLRTINNNLGHEKGDEYIRSFAVELRKAMPDEYFAGRDGGDEFIAVFHGLDHPKMRDMLQMIREHMAAYSADHPEMPLSYAVGYALSCDFDQCTMWELFRLADKNMYVDKNRAKMEETEARKRKDRSILAWVREQNYNFSDCMYCDARQDQYRVLRATSEQGTYDMILMDIMMPVMNGMEAAAYIRKMERSDAKEIPILALTAQVTSESIVECGKAGMDGHITKPIEPQKLKEQIFTYFT